MDKVVIITTMFDFLMSKGLAHKQSDLVKRMKSTPSNVSKALSGDPKALTDNFLMRLNAAYGNIFDPNWIKTGTGNMLAVNGLNNLGNINVGDISNSSNVAVGHSSIPDGLMERNEPSMPGGTAPVIPVRMMSMGCDIVEAATKLEGTQRLYCGDIDIDAYILLTDNALAPEYLPMDYIGIKAYKPKESIIPGNLYAVNTKSNGMVLRYLRYDDKGNFVAYTKNGSTQEFTIAKSDVVKVYKKMIMFRY